MNRATALQLAEEHFPNGPERIAAILGAEVVFASISIDGWCIVPPNGDPPIITVNSDAPRNRQRFTLAHELAHLLLGTKPDLVGRRDRDLYSPNSLEESAANQLAAELLLPLSQLGPLLQYPIDSRVITSVATRCGVAEITLVLRLTRNAELFRMSYPTVAKLEDNIVAWKMPFDRPLPDSLAASLYDQASRAGGTSRTSSKQGEPVLVCALSNPTYPVLFYYWLPSDQADQETLAEKRGRLERELFATAPRFQQRVNACLGAFKPSVQQMTLEQALEAFHERYDERLTESFGDRYPSLVAEEYLRLRLSEWATDGRTGSGLPPSPEY